MFFNKSLIKERKKSERLLDFLTYNDKESNHNNSDIIINRIVNKIQLNKRTKKLPFYSSFATPICTYSNHNLKKNKLFLK